MKLTFIAKVSACFLLATALLNILWDEISSPLLFNTLRYNANPNRAYIPTFLDPDRPRALSQSIDLGGGKCKWMPPLYSVPEEEDFHKTLIVGYPSGDKRMVFIQMEALAGYPAKDEWDFAYLGKSRAVHLLFFIYM